MGVFVCFTPSICIKASHTHPQSVPTRVLCVHGWILVGIVDLLASATDISFIPVTTQLWTISYVSSKQCKFLKGKKGNCFLEKEDVSEMHTLAPLFNMALIHPCVHCRCTISMIRSEFFVCFDFLWLPNACAGIFFSLVLQMLDSPSLWWKTISRSPIAEAE